MQYEKETLTNKWYLNAQKNDKIERPRKSHIPKQCNVAII